MPPTWPSHVGQELGETISISVRCKGLMIEKGAWNHPGHPWEKGKKHGCAGQPCCSVCMCSYLCCTFTAVTRSFWVEWYRNACIYGGRKYCVFHELLCVCVFTHIHTERKRNQERTGRACVLIKRDIAGGVHAALWAQLRTDLKKK